MVKNIPDRWLDYKPVGRAIYGTNFIPFKVPLRKTFNKYIHDKKMLFTQANLVKSIPHLGLVIDLTNTDRYYDPNEFKQLGIKYVKITSPGHAIPTLIIRKQFSDVVNNFLNSNSNKLIGVHCTHGINRSGFLICHYMITEMNMDPQEAISRFEFARGYSIERRNYIDYLVNDSPKERSKYNCDRTFINTYDISNFNLRPEYAEQKNLYTNNNMKHDYEIYENATQEITETFNQSNDEQKYMWRDHENKSYLSKRHNEIKKFDGNCFVNESADYLGNSGTLQYNSNNFENNIQFHDQDSSNIRFENPSRKHQNVRWKEMPMQNKWSFSKDSHFYDKSNSTFRTKKTNSGNWKTQVNMPITERAKYTWSREPGNSLRDRLKEMPPQNKWCDPNDSFPGNKNDSTFKNTITSSAIRRTQLNRKPIIDHAKFNWRRESRKAQDVWLEEMPTQNTRFCPKASLLCDKNDSIFGNKNSEMLKTQINQVPITEHAKFTRPQKPYYENKHKIN